MNVTEQIEKFYKSFRYTNLNVLEDAVIYSFSTREQAKQVAKEALGLIQKLELPLTVQWESNSQLFDKIVLIKGI